MRIVVCLALMLVVTACTRTGATALQNASPPQRAPTPVERPIPPPAPSPIGTLTPFSSRLIGPIQRMSSEVGVAATESGLIGTDDGGRSWTIRMRADGTLFTELRFVDPLHGWAIVERWAPTTICLSPKTASPCWTVARTSDGGRSWTDTLSVRANQLGTPPITSLQAIDEGLAWVVIQTGACAVEGCIGELRTTRDGGRTWTTQLSRVGGLGPVRFASAERGWIAAVRPGDVNGGADVLASPDGGVTWTTVYRSATGVLSVDAASERDAWILTRDGGYCTSSNCSRYELLYTADSGASWSALGDPKEQASCSGGHLRGPVFATPLLGWMAISLGAGGANVGPGGVMRTRDGGRTWDCRVSPQNVAQVSAADPKELWLRSDPGPNSTKDAIPQLLATADSGDTWEVVPVVIH